MVGGDAGQGTVVQWGQVLAEGVSQPVPGLVGARVGFDPPGRVVAEQLPAVPGVGEDLRAQVVVWFDLVVAGLPGGGEGLLTLLAVRPIPDGVRPLRVLALDDDGHFHSPRLRPDPWT